MSSFIPSRTDLSEALRLAGRMDTFGWLHSFFKPVMAASTMADLPVAIVFAAFSERKCR